jgi:hypothetical protein
LLTTPLTVPPRRTLSIISNGLLTPEIGLPQWVPGIAALLMLVIFRKDDFKLNVFLRDTSVSEIQDF